MLLMPFSLLWIILSVQSIHWGTNNLRLIHQQLGSAYVGILDNTIFLDNTKIYQNHTMMLLR